MGLKSLHLVCVVDYSNASLGEHCVNMYIIRQEIHIRPIYVLYKHGAEGRKCDTLLQ